MIVFVHGVPETAAVWTKVRAAIDRESVALSLPGFGCERPAGFGATKDEYVAWLLGELDAVDGPVDLVGHDWGAPLTFRVASEHSDRLRSWVADVGGLMHPDYEWHEFAKVWQTPGEGEAFIEGQNSLSVEDRAGVFETMGISHDDALEMSAGSDATMGACILDLYRSAVPNCYADWGPYAVPSAPGMILLATDDPFADGSAKTDAVAELFGARVEKLEGVGHFWPYQAPDVAAAVLESFWSSLD